VNLLKDAKFEIVTVNDSKKPKSKTGSSHSPKKPTSHHHPQPVAAVV
jgi:hypothetical protein